VLRRSRGFSLLELIVVAGIIAMIALMTVPSLASSLKGRRLRGAEQAIKGALNTARSAAIARRTIYCVDFTVTGGAAKIYIQDELDRPLGRGADLPDLVEFDSDSSRTTISDTDVPSGYTTDPDSYPDIWFGPDGSVMDTSGIKIGVKEKNASYGGAGDPKFRQIQLNRWTGMAKAVQP